ncbi:MAG: thioredoxin TrxC [Candidatus Marinarcus sp.]|uniref:thioredoxin TrxC n=1 Tax=Candidatus Marinarcus sp. TaxID=3100987 RepID=UPI003B001A46
MDKIKVVCASCHSVNFIPKKESYAKANCGQCKHSLLDTKPFELTELSFDNAVVNSDLPVVVDFWAPWCGPCKMMGPVFEKVSAQFPLKARFAKVNTEQEQNLGATYNIRSIPTLIIYQNGVEVHRVSGAMDETNLSQLVKRFI